MTQFDTRDMSDDEAMTDGDDTVVTRFSKTTAATDDNDSIASRFSLAEHLQMDVDINEITADATSNYDSQKMTVLDYTPIVSNTTAPDRELSLPNASSLADQLEDEAKPKSSNAHIIASSDTRRDPSVHKFNMPSPLQNAIAGTKPKESHPLFAGRERVDDVTMLINFTNKAKQHTSVTRDVFEQLISCTWDGDVIGWKLTGLSWREVKFRAGTIFKELSKLEPFKSFKASDIENMYSTDGNVINLHVVITNNCRHREGEHTRQCRGLVRQDLISKNTTLKSGRKIALDPDAVYNSNIGQNEDEDASLSSRQVAYNLSSESKQQTMHDRGLVKGAYSANFYKAAQEIMDEDLAIRQSIAVDGASASEDHLVHGSRHLGIVRFAGYEAPDEGNRCTTPYRCVLHSARGVQIGHSACETRDSARRFQSRWN
eukprot:scaffold33810_cov88-Cyclotella_meneghiniana.AAC.1